MPALVLLFIAIATEVVATACLPRTQGFRDPAWSALVLAGYGLSIWLLALVVRELPVSVTYAIWSGMGTAAIAVIGIAFLGESWDWVKVVALVMIVGGVVALHLHGAQ